VASNARPVTSSDLDHGELDSCSCCCAKGTLCSAAVRDVGLAADSPTREAGPTMIDEGLPIIPVESTAAVRILGSIKDGDSPEEE
jgi:hypothetical protein